MPFRSEPRFYKLDYAALKKAISCHSRMRKGVLLGICCLLLFLVFFGFCAGFEGRRPFNWPGVDVATPGSLVVIESGGLETA